MKQQETLENAIKNNNDKNSIKNTEQAVNQAADQPGNHPCCGKEAGLHDLQRSLPNFYNSEF